MSMWTVCGWQVEREWSIYCLVHHIHIYTNAYIYIYIYKCIYIHMQIHIYEYMCVYIHTLIRWRGSGASTVFLMGSDGACSC